MRTPRPHPVTLSLSLLTTVAHQHRCLRRARWRSSVRSAVHLTCAPSGQITFISFLNSFRRTFAVGENILSHEIRISKKIFFNAQIKTIWIVSFFERVFGLHDECSCGHWGPVLLRLTAQHLGHYICDPDRWPSQEGSPIESQTRPAAGPAAHGGEILILIPTQRLYRWGKPADDEDPLVMGCFALHDSDSIGTALECAHRTFLNI